MNRICVIGNAGAGKTTLSRRLEKIYQLPVYHVDQIQYLNDLSIRPMNETRSIMNDWMSREKWIIDGFGPLDLLEKQLRLANLIIFIDFPLWRHLWWCTKRQIKNFYFKKRAELPEGSTELTWKHTRKIYQNLLQVHYKMNPELRRILSRDSLNKKVLVISNLKQWNKVYLAKPNVILVPEL